MGTDEELTNDEIFDILSNSRRRRLLYYLHRRDGSAEIRELARLIAAEENDIEPEDVSEDAVRRVYISLYQLHVPNLTEHGLLEHDEDAARVSLTDRVDEILEVFLVERPPWSLYYGVVGLGGALLVAVVAFGIVPVSTTAVAALIVVAVLALSVVHYYTEQRAEPRDLLSGLV